MSDLNIRQRINQVRKKVGYIQKDSLVSTGGSNYKAVSHDNVLASIRSGLIENGISIEPSLVEHGWQEPRKGGSTMWIYEAIYDVAFVNIDSPNGQDKVLIRTSGHGADSGDKAAGKALSYAVKNATLKLFALETGLDDESRAYDPKDYTQDQLDTFNELLASGKAQQFQCWMYNLPSELQTGLVNSFPEGKKSEGKKLCRKMQTDGVVEAQNTADQIKELAEAKDPAVLEITDELKAYEKRYIINMLEPHHIEFLTKLSQGVG